MTLRSSFRRGSLPAALVALALVAGGCGDDGDEPSAARESTTATVPEPPEEALDALRKAGVENAEEVITEAAIPETKSAQRELDSGAAEDADTPTPNQKRLFEQGQRQIAELQKQSRDAQRQIREAAKAQRYGQCVLDAGDELDALQACSKSRK